MKRSAIEFERDYAYRSGLTVEQLREFRTVQPCDCGDPICEGWVSVSYETAMEMDAIRQERTKDRAT